MFFTGIYDWEKNMDYDKFKANLRLHQIICEW